MDVFVDRKKRVWIVDFNPFGDPSSALLFEWSELLSLIPPIPVPDIEKSAVGANIDNPSELYVESQRHKKEQVEINTLSEKISDVEFDKEIDFEFRIILNQRETFPSASGSSRGPIDVTLAPDFHKFMQICKHQDKDEEGEGEGEEEEEEEKW